jgi:hypothetical protein
LPPGGGGQEPLPLPAGGGGQEPLPLPLPVGVGFETGGATGLGLGADFEETGGGSDFDDTGGGTGLGLGADLDDTGGGLDSFAMADLEEELCGPTGQW